MIKNLVISAIIFFSYAGAFAQGTVKGRVLDERGFPVPGVYVSINGIAGSSTDKEGKFAVIVEKLPYNLVIHDESNSLAVLYEDMKRMDPELVLFGAKSSRSVNTESMKINFPAVPSGSSALIKFISDDLFYSQDVVANTGETSKIITVDWPNNTNSVNGRVIYLEKTSTAYTKYIEKAVTVLKDFSSQSVTFDNANFIKPGQTSITLYMPNANYERKGFAVYADFLALHRNSQILLNSEEGDIISTRCLVPSNLPLSFRLRVEGNGFYKDGDGFQNSVYSYPGTSLNISTETPPELTAPQDKFTGVSPYTEFAYEWGSGTGIYVVHFHSYFPDGDFYVVTAGRSVSAPIQKSAGVLKGNEYKWYTAKYLTYFNIDDFTKPKQFSNDIGYRAVTYSAPRTFKLKQ
jgi:hypothetical protein